MINYKMDSFQAIESLFQNLQLLSPVLLPVAALFILLRARSHFASLRGCEFILVLILAVGISAAVRFSNYSELNSILESYSKLSESTKYLCGVLTATCFYFFFYVSTSEFERKDVKISKKKSVESTNISYPLDMDWTKNTKESFQNICSSLISECIDDLRDNFEGIPEQIAWVKSMMEYNVKGGKMNRGLGVIDVQKAFAEQSGKTLSNYDFCRAAVLGCCIELLQAFFLVADDVMDDSHTRRGQPCWFRVPHVKHIAINDAFILESLVYRILKNHFSNEPYYLKLLELFHDVTYRTEMGQLLDLTSQVHKYKFIDLKIPKSFFVKQPLDAPSDFSRFTSVRYSMIVKYKTAFYTFYLPCAIGMIYAGVSDPRSFELARRICSIIGEYFQIQDDVLDCFGDPKVIGKIGTDIQDKKCSWLVVKALEKCNEKQKKELVENYGRNDASKIEKVKAIYNQLDLQKEFDMFEERSYQMIEKLISQVDDIPKDVYMNFVKRIYKRKM